jgi:predicted nucleic acid-binding protein
LENRLIVIDTDVVIDFFKDAIPGANAVSDLISRGQAAMTSVSVFELYAGVEGKRRLRQIERLVESLLILPLDVIEAAVAGKIYTRLKSKGHLIGTRDILIAGICLANELPLYTRNVAHFSRVEDLQVLSTEEILQ